MKNSESQVQRIKKIFLLCIISAIILGVILFTWGVTFIPEGIRIWVAYFPFFLFTIGIIGWIIAYEGRVKHGYSWMIYFPLILGLLYYLLLFLHVFIIEPILCPCLKPTM